MSDREPLGLRPKRFADQHRIAEILVAIERYNEALKPIPRLWFSELECLLYPLNQIETDEG